LKAERTNVPIVLNRPDGLFDDHFPQERVDA